MSKDSTAKYYQDNKERLQKKLVEDMKDFLNKKNSNNIGVNNKVRKQNLVEYRKKKKIIK